MKLGEKLCTIVVVLVMLLMVSAPAYAASYQVLHLEQGQIWTRGYGEIHNTAYIRCGAMCHSVYPYTGSDSYSRIQCKVTNTYREVIVTAPYYVLHEGASSYTAMHLKDGYLNTSTVYFHFRSNSSEQAQAVVSYTGTITS